MRNVTRITAILFLLCCFFSTELRARDWLDSTGKHRIQADFVAARGDKVVLEKPDGTIISVPLTKLSQADQDYIKELTAPKPSGNEASNMPAKDKDSKASSTSGTVPQNASELADRTEKILKDACYRCHGEDGSNEGGFNYVVNLEKLSHTIAKGKESAGSLLLSRMTATDEGVMPPVGESPRPSPSDIATVKAWIDAGSPVKPSNVKRSFVTQDKIVLAIQKDIAQQGERGRRFMRYFTLTHLYNAGVSEDELQTYRNAFSKLINSLSWNTELLTPRSIDPEKTVYGIDIRDLHWNIDMWRAIEKANPYFLSLASPEFKSCVQDTQTEMPYIRIDWFVFAASKPPLYHVLLNLPESDRELEDLLRVNVAANVQQERTIRAAFNRSGVSQNNRLIEWHKSPYGSYWKSYDFGGSTGQKNLFQYPLGPTGAKENFRHDGGEIIFSLPNGLQGYLLVDEKGKRIDQGPTSIVSDPKRPDKTVTNGVSCMSCHYTGVIPKRDEVGEAVRANRNAYVEAEDILALYRKSTELDEIFDKDGQRFANSLRTLGIQNLSRSGEPVSAMASNFDQEIDLRQVACEFGLEESELKKRLPETNTVARAFSSLLVPGGTIKRDVFKSMFGDASIELKLNVDLSVKITENSSSQRGSIRTPKAIEPTDKSPSNTAPRVARPRTTGPIDGTVVAKFQDLTWGVKSLAISPDGKFLAAGKPDRKITLFDIENQSEAGSLEKLELLGAVSYCKFTNSGKHLIAGGDTGQILVFSVSDEGLIRQVGQFAGHSSAIHCISISADDQFVISGGQDKKACFWELESGEQLATISEFEGPVKAVFIHKNNRTLLATDGGTLVEYDAVKKEPKRRRSLGKSWASGQSAAFSSDGEWVASGDSYNVRVWQVGTGKEQPGLVGNEIQWSIVFTPDGNRILTGGSSKVGIWDLKKAQRLHVQQIGNSGYVQTLAVSDDGKFFAAPGSSNREIHVVRISKP